MAFFILITLLFHPLAEAASFDTEWLRLLHYKKQRLGGYESDADVETFFVSSRGKFDPQAELDASEIAFFSRDARLKYAPYQEGEIPDSEYHPQCIFPARYRYLKTKLNKDDAADVPCTRYNEWRARLNTSSITLIFASAYLNNPASSFGHTFLRLNSGRHDLLDYGVNYAAMTPPSRGLLYALSGIFGGYLGAFSLLPYHVKVNEYNEGEQRDLWEYAVNFTPAELERFMAHLWEVGVFASNYYFFKRNCSREVLTLFEYVRPDLDLTTRLPPWVIPSHTLRILKGIPGLLREGEFRPSLASRLESKVTALNVSQRNEFDQFVSFSKLPADTAVLEAASDYLQYKKSTSEKGLTLDETALHHKILVQRSKTQAKTAASKTSAPPPPHSGHNVFRTALGAGVSSDFGSFEQLDLRPAFHDLLARSDGYDPSLELELLRIKVRYYNRRQKLKLEKLDLAQVTSLSPRDKFLNALSWHGSFGYETRRDVDCDLCGFGQAQFGIGETKTLARNTTAFLFADTALQISGRFEHGFRFGPALSGGIYFEPLPFWRIKPAAKIQWFPLGDSSVSNWSYEGRIDQNFSIADHWEIRIEGARYRATQEISLNLAHYL